MAKVGKKYEKLWIYDLMIKKDFIFGQNRRKKSCHKNPINSTASVFPSSSSMFFVKI